MTLLSLSQMLVLNFLYFLCVDNCTERSSSPIDRTFGPVFVHCRPLQWLSAKQKTNLYFALRVSYFETHRLLHIHVQTLRCKTRHAQSTKVKSLPLFYVFEKKEYLKNRYNVIVVIWNSFHLLVEKQTIILTLQFCF